MTDPVCVVVGHNSEEWLTTCLRCLTASPEGLHVVYVDNASSDTSCGIARDLPKVNVIELRHNYGFGTACNIGALYAQLSLGASTVVFINPDVVTTPRVIRELASILSTDKRIGALGPLQRELGSRPREQYNNWTRRSPLVVHVDPSRQGRVSPMPDGHFARWVERPERRLNVGYVNGAAMAVPLNALWQVGGFDPAFFLFFEEVDLCRRLRSAGFRVQLSLDHEIEHQWGGHASGYRQTAWLASKYTFLATEPASGARVAFKIATEILDDLRQSPPEARQILQALLRVVSRRRLVALLRRRNLELRITESSSFVQSP